MAQSRPAFAPRRAPAVALREPARDTHAMNERRVAGPSVPLVPEGDNRVRLVCPDCGFILYENPKVVVGAVCMWNDQVLLCERAIPPRAGYWTIPAGYMELNESTAQGAEREVREEAGADVEMGELIGIYDIPRISQVYVIYRARLTRSDIAAGPESRAVALFDWSDIPWDDIAFSSVTWALHRTREGHDSAQAGEASRADRG